MEHGNTVNKLETVGVIENIELNKTSVVRDFWQKNLQYLTIANIFKVIFLLAFCTFIYKKYTPSHQEEVDTLTYLAKPKIDDIYFLDFRILSDDLRPQEKYRTAKVVDITGDVITLLYSNMFYLHQKAIKDSISLGQLRIKKYFEPKRHDFTLAQLKSMHDSRAIYLIKRPEHNTLYGNYINEPKESVRSTIYIPGKRENFAGLSFLASVHLENNLEQAFDRFSKSAKVGFSQGQVNLAQMYLNGQYVEKDLSKAMYWFEQAALQSNKAGVLKYVIVCRQVSYCQEGDFFQRLTDAGVNIKVKEVDMKLNTL